VLDRGGGGGKKGAKNKKCCCLSLWDKHWAFLKKGGGGGGGDVFPGGRGGRERGEEGRGKTDTMGTIGTNFWSISSRGLFGVGLYGQGTHGGGRGNGLVLLLRGGQQTTGAQKKTVGRAICDSRRGGIFF